MAKKKYTIEDCKEIARQRGYVLLSTEYKNVDDNGLLWKCDKGHTWNTRLWVIKAGHKCPHCVHKAKHTIDECHNFAKTHGGLCLSAYYRNVIRKLRWQCHCGFVWTASFGYVLSGHWCPKCSCRQKVTIARCRDAAASFGGLCLSKRYNCANKLKWQCSKGHVWRALFTNINYKNSWCPECSKNVPRKIEDACLIAEKRGGCCLSKTMYGVHKKLLWSCHYGHEWLASFHSVDRGSWCPECCANKKQIDLCNVLREIFPRAVIKTNYTGFDWLIGKLGRKMEIDIWIEDKKLAIEYDGEQHFRPVCFGGISLAKAKYNLTKQKKRDETKNKIINEHNNEIQYFIRFGYKEKLDKNAVLEKLINHGVTIHTEEQSNGNNL